MAPFMRLDLVRARADDVRTAFERLMGSPRVVARPSSKQWAFLRACFERLIEPSFPETRTERRAAAQYRFEIETKLRGHYQSPGPEAAFVFSLADRDHALRQGAIDERYPANAGYVLLVSQGQLEQAAPRDGVELKEYLVRLVDDAVRAEFTAYAALPSVDLSSLEGVFVPGGSAFRRIQDVVARRSAEKHTIRHPAYNPSTMRVLGARVGPVAEREATVFTQEYWYLRWWSLRESRYVYVYNEMNRQRYALCPVGGRWLVDANIYPPPRTAALARRPERRGTSLR